MTTLEMEIREAPAAEARAETEDEMRRRLGVPRDAEHVLVFGETSHWDPNWLFTSEEYYRRRIERILDEAVQELERESRRVFSIECLFFLQLYWTRRPHVQDRVRRLVNEGRLRFTGTGITTPDTLLPSSEAILRDYLLGQEWLRKNGMTQEPRLAYLPDNFGHSPALPAILSSLGFDQAGITRIDGMYFVGSDYRLASSYPRAGSSAALLGDELETQDFVWRAPDGSEVLCHWNAFTYFQGDMLAHLGVIRWMGVAFGFPWRTGRHIAGRVQRLVAELRPLSRTPYLFCPIGCDFNGPIPSLVELLDRHNRTYFQDTGVFAVNADMETHLSLVDFHRDRLPVLELDPNPYWMGFYASRPGFKRLVNRASRKLVLAEKLSLLAGAPDDPPAPELERAWELVAVSNHHDFITGTTPDRVFWEEQMPWMTEAEALADQLIARVRPDVPPLAEEAAEPVTWWLTEGRLSVLTPHYRVVLSEESGGCIVRMESPPGGPERTAGPANDLVAYSDSGGLWRMGHEYLGGHFREVARASAQPARIHAREERGVLEVRVESSLLGERIVRRLWFRGDSAVIRMRLEGSAPRRHTITCRFPTRSDARTLTMNVPGGVIEREQYKLFDPTFWPARSFAHLEDERGWGFAAFLGGPACVGLRAPGTMEWVSIRNAPMERAFGFLPLPAHPASGSESGQTDFDYAVWLTGAGDHRENRLAKRVRRALRAALFEPGAVDLDEIANRLVVADHPDVLVTAVKVASRGEGRIVRLRSVAPRGETLQIRLLCSVAPIRAARLCDARERDVSELRVEDAAAVVPVSRAIVSVRLLF